MGITSHWKLKVCASKSQGIANTLEGLKRQQRQLLSVKQF